VTGKAAVCAFPGGTLIAANPAGKAASDKVSIALRPEKLSLSDGTGSGDLSGKIVDRIYLGTDTTYLVAISDDLILRVRDQNKMPGAAGFATGTQVSITVPMGAARILEG
jgi:spermidine/putrescine transport system ATP-binding protein